MAKQKSAHYVDNKKFLQAMIEWHAVCEEKGEQNTLPHSSLESFSHLGGDWPLASVKGLLALLGGHSQRVGGRW